MHLRRSHAVSALLLCVLGLLGLSTAHAGTLTCLPKPTWPTNMTVGTVPATVSTRFDHTAVWVCATPTGYVTNGAIFQVSDLVNQVVAYATGSLSLSEVNADCAANCQTLTDAEQAFLNQVIAGSTPTALVAFNGANTTRSVYSANADGTLNPTPIAGSSVAVAGACDASRRLAGTPYYSVSGQPDASHAGNTLATGIYAVCVVSLPIGSN